MAKEFDIYLNERLHQCDIIVYSIPYRDGMTVMNRLILETCLESYLLQKFIAVQSGSMLVSHIDKMIKTCRERLNNGVMLGSSAEFHVHYSSYPEGSAIELSAERLKTMANVYASAESALQLASSPVSAYVKKPFGRGQSGIEIVSNVEATFKRSFEKASSQLLVEASELKTKKKASEKVSSPIVMNSELVDLLYRLCDTTTIAIQIAAQAVETEIHFSLGRCQFPIVLDSQVLGEQMRKYAAMESVVEILSSVTESLTQFMSPEVNALEIASEVDAIIKRHRLLYEMDSDTLSTYDDMSFKDVDYVIL
jgi:hypothetical protein